MVRLLGNNPDSFTEISKYLIFCGADVRKCNKIGKTPMDYGVGTQVEKDLREVYEQLTKYVSLLLLLDSISYQHVNFITFILI